MRKLDTAQLLPRLKSIGASIGTDGQLLEEFLSHRDETSFAELVSRHGPMVLGVCRRIVGSLHDAEEAFQATFILLAQKAGSIMPREAIGSWLHGVACRVAMKNRTMLRRRQFHERQAAGLRSESSFDLVPAGDLHWILDQELQRLPMPYRLLVILCDLQGGTFRHVARQLNLPVGTLSGRLKRGRQLLAERLARRGITLSTACLAATLCESAQAQVPLSWALAAVRASLACIHSGSLSCGVVNSTVISLVKGTALAMMWNQIKLVSCVGLLTLALSVGWFVSSGMAQDKYQKNRAAEDDAVRRTSVLAASSKPSFQVQLTVYEKTDGEYRAVTSPRLIVLPHQKAIVQTGEAVSMKSSKVTPDWWHVGFQAEVEVQPDGDEQVIVQLKAQQTRVRESKKDLFCTDTHSQSTAYVCKLTKTVDLPWEPFGTEGKIQIKVMQIMANPPKTVVEQNNKALDTKTVQLMNADAQDVARVLQQVSNSSARNVMVDDRTNSLVLRGTPEELAKYREVIKKLDPKSRSDADARVEAIDALAARRYDAWASANKNVQPPSATAPRLTVTIGDDYEINKMLSAAQKLNKDKPKVELEYDYARHQLIIKVLVDDLKLSELNKLLDAGKASPIRR